MGPRRDTGPEMFDARLEMMAGQRGHFRERQGQWHQAREGKEGHFELFRTPHALLLSYAISQYRKSRGLQILRKEFTGSSHATAGRVEVK